LAKANHNLGIPKNIYLMTKGADKDLEIAEIQIFESLLN